MNFNDFAIEKWDNDILNTLSESDIANIIISSPYFYKNIDKAMGLGLKELAEAIGIYNINSYELFSMDGIFEISANEELLALCTSFDQVLNMVSDELDLTKDDIVEVRIYEQGKPHPKCIYSVYINGDSHILAINGKLEQKRIVTSNLILKHPFNLGDKVNAIVDGAVLIDAVIGKNNNDGTYLLYYNDRDTIKSINLFATCIRHSEFNDTVLDMLALAYRGTITVGTLTTAITSLH